MILEIQNLSKYYETTGSNIHREVLNNINLSLKGNDSIAILGPSGSGKSTLLNLIGALDKPNTGHVIFNGKDLNQMTANQMAEFRNSHIGFVFQQHHLLPQLTVLENVLLPTLPQKDELLKKKAAKRAMDLIESVDLVGHAYKLPGQLSGGECQRVAVIRSLINEPELLLADEPTGSLDNESSEKLGNLLLKLNASKQVAMIVVTHSESLAAQMGKVFRLNNGRLSN